MIIKPIITRDSLLACAEKQSKELRMLFGSKMGKREVSSQMAKAIVKEISTKLGTMEHNCFQGKHKYTLAIKGAAFVKLTSADTPDRVSVVWSIDDLNILKLLRQHQIKTA